MARLRTAATWAAVAFVLGAGQPGTQRVPEPTPPPPGTLSITSTLRIPGIPPRLPWPPGGQAAVEVAGIGSLGSAGGTGPVPVASVAKVMTALVVLTDHPLAAGQDGPPVTVTAAEATAYTSEAHDGQSHIPVRAGEVLTERQALQAMLLPSANNIARVLARWDAGSVTAFVARMNIAAAVLGMTDTRYTDPAGFDPATVSTAADQLTLAVRAMAVPALAQTVSMRTATVPLAGTVRNTNLLVGTAGFVGIKTGSMTRSGGCLLFAARATVPGTTAPGGRASGTTVTVLGAVLGQDGLSYAGLGPTFRASQALVAAATRAVGPRLLLPAGATVGHLAGADLVTAAPVTVLGWAGLAVTAHLSAAAAPTTPGAAVVGQLQVTGPGAGARTTVPVLLRR